MADEIKIYYPSTIEDTTPYSITSESGNSTTTKDSGDVQAPPSTSGVSIPVVPNANELVGIAFDTQARRIQSDFTFSQSGSLRIGKYVSGEQGEVVISPNGIVAKNSAGDTTFTLDGVTGDATFKGTITTGAVVTGGVVIQGQGAYRVNDGTYDIILLGYQSGGF